MKDDLTNRIARFREKYADLWAMNAPETLPLLEECRKRIEELEQEIKLRCDLHGDCERENERLKARVVELEQRAEIDASMTTERLHEIAQLRNEAGTFKGRIEELEQELRLAKHLQDDERHHKTLYYVQLQETQQHLDLALPKAAAACVVEARLKAQLESAEDEWTKESALHTAKAAETLALYEAGRKQLESAEALLRDADFYLSRASFSTDVKRAIADYFAKKEKEAKDGQG